VRSAARPFPPAARARVGPFAPFAPFARVVVLMLPTLAGGCAFVAGNPWGDIDVALAAGFAPGPLRIDEEGRLKTAQSYAIAIDELEATFAAITIQQADPAKKALSFDPARPPPGFSLCHGGHCHADDGRLVPYAEVEASIVGGDARIPEAPFDLQGVTVPLGADLAPLAAVCAADPCLLERGPIVAAALEVPRVHVRGTAFDLLNDARLPPEGAPFEADFELPAALFVDLDAEAERFQPLHFLVQARFLLAEGFLDDVDFAADVTDGVLSPEALAEAALTIVERSLFSAAIGPLEGERR
jgi:hypothetical protein